MASGKAIAVHIRTDYSGVGSTWTNGLLRFGAVLDAEPVRIQPSAALAATNGVKGVAR